MPKATDYLYYLIHVRELRSIVQWKVWHQPVHERQIGKESLTTEICFHFLDKTSRSFSAVIQELHPELLHPICLFYLILRGLDTVEDDTSIPVATKTPILRDFYKRLDEDGWCFDGNRPEEKDRDLLVQFKHVITEFKKQKAPYREIIADVTRKMGNGMADYVESAEIEGSGVQTIKDYDLYCYYVAGLVGEGLTRLFVESEKGNEELLKRPKLHRSMGLFLQKTNIIRDVREDFDDNRKFWPREIWSRHVDSIGDLFKPENKEAALDCVSDMVLNALDHTQDCLFYLAGLREQSVFNFCAIPQTMAIATLALCFRNPAVLQRNVKISKGEACQLMIESTQNLQLVCEVFRRYVRVIHRKNVPQDPNFLKISIACGQVEQFIEQIFPSQKPDHIVKTSPQVRTKGEQDAKDDSFYIIVAIFSMLVVVVIAMLLVAYFLGARFDLAIDDLRNSWPQASASPKETVVQKIQHVEL